jgi:molybdopterin-containing oxidoreductase family iron-sulfur binding subunit
MGTVPFFPDDPQGISRRRWLQLMGASLALAGAAGCRWEKREIRPFAKRPTDRVPGQVQKFATTMDIAGSALGLLVTCVDGRPIKVEGNPKHPASLGATNAFAQAAILELYDPDRSKNIIEQTRQGEKVRTWEEFSTFAREHFGKLRASGGEGLRVLSEASSSPTLARMRGEFLKQFPKAKWHEYEPIQGFRHRPDFNGLLCGPRYDLAKARTIVCLDADILGSHPDAVRHARDFAAGRDPASGETNRLYVVESTYSITGAAADHRWALPCKDIAAVAAALAHEVQGLASGKPFRESTHAFIRAAAKDLLAQRERSVVIAGARQPATAHDIADAISGFLGGLTPAYGPAGDSEHVLFSEKIASLAADVNAGEVQTLLILGGNPAYNAPADLRLSGALAKVPSAIQLSLYRNETARLCAWHIPQAHFLEAWGDWHYGNWLEYSVAQPLIEPLYAGKSAIELLALLLGTEAARSDALVRETFKGLVRPEADFEAAWQRTLHDGTHLLEEFEIGEVDDLSQLKAPPEIAEPTIENGNLEIIFTPDYKVYDGRFANNGWLQELPDPMTRLTWDNAALMSPATAAKLGVQHEDVVRLKYEGRELEAPVYVMPGQADGTVALPLGYGRTAAGVVGGSQAEGIPPVGFNAYLLRTSKAMDFGTGLTVEPTGRKHKLATVGDPQAIDAVGRQSRQERLPELVRQGTLEEYQKDPQFARKMAEHPPLKSLWQEPRYPGRRWAMTIDLSKCIGCGTCVVACQAENNIPVVGKEQVIRGRQMQWLRIDRYFRGPAARPEAVFQPMACQHCEMAPCEAVCPVAATVHSAEGLNEMVYNRCVGTRYCSNNCPYKVRRFNYFNYHKFLEDPAKEVVKMAFNPEVTIRSRGVMEKCTYCVQRIQHAKIEAKNARRPLTDGQIKTACQQACPTQAIIFGDLSDRTSAVALAAADPRAYALLAELDTKPRTAYLARIRNPNPELEKLEKEE